MTFMKEPKGIKIKNKIKNESSYIIFINKFFCTINDLVKIII